LISLELLIVCGGMVMLNEDVLRFGVKLWIGGDFMSEMILVIGFGVDVSVVGLDVFVVGVDTSVK